MKTSLLLLALLLSLVVAPRGGAQVRQLQPGDTITYTFTHLPHFGPFGDTVPTPPQAQWFAVVSADDPNSAIRYELFEDSAAATPIAAGEWTLNSPLPSVEMPGAWQDRQGVVRFTGVRGTVDLQSFDVRVLTPIDTFRYDEFRRTFPAAPAPRAPRTVVDFNRYASPEDNDLASHFHRYVGVSQVQGAGITGGAAGGSLAEVTTYGFAVCRSGLRNLPGDTNEVSAFFKIVPSTFRPSSGGSFKLLFSRSTNEADLFTPHPVEARFFGPGDSFSMPADFNFNWGSVTNTNWFRLTLNLFNSGESNRFGVVVSLQDFGPGGLAPVGPLFSSAWDTSNAELARSPVVFPAFYVDGVRFGRTLVDDFGFSGAAFRAPVLTATRAEGALRLAWVFPGTNFVLESTAALNPPTVWTPVNETETYEGEEHSVLVPFDQAKAFFRLRYR